MAYPLGWERFVGDGGSILGINHFGASAPGERIMQEFGYTVDNVVARVKALL
jgi:transketolase